MRGNKGIDDKHEKIYDKRMEIDDKTNSFEPIPNNFW